jgi:glycosyltransferase involved in cell wall biosynthesis
MLYVGTEDPRKDLATLLRALALVRRDRPEVHLIKAGRAHFGGQRQHLVRLTDELHLRDAVHFLDDVEEADLPALYNLASVFATPSLYEGFGFPPLEAMACGRPVVSTRAGSLPEIVGEAGLLVPPGDPRGLADAILQVLGDPVLARRLGSLGPEQAARFTWDRTVNQTLAVYDCLSLGERRPLQQTPDLRPEDHREGQHQWHDADREAASERRARPVLDATGNVLRNRRGEQHEHEDQHSPVRIGDTT